MGDAKRKEKRKQLFRKENPICCFCGGTVRTTTWDHIPPQACFPEGHFPEGFEFPACESCNLGTREHDQIFSFYAHLLDFDDANRDWSIIEKLMKGIANNRPDALPSIESSANRKRVALRHMGLQRAPGQPLSNVPMMDVPSVLGEAATTINRKLACALNYRERGKIISSNHRIVVGWNQLQNRHLEPLVRYLAELLPNQTIGTRTNIKKYGHRFGYKSGVNEPEDFFMYAAQFGAGLILWGIVTPPGMKTPSGPFEAMTHMVFGPAPMPIDA